jgi:ABC-2 type transport system permease protein
MWKVLIDRLNELQVIFVKELKNALQDAGTILIFGVAVVAYPVLYSIGYMNESLKEVPVAVVDLDHSAYSRQYLRMLDATEQVSVVARPLNLKDAEKLFYEGTINGVFLIPEHFGKDILDRRQTQVLVYCDASRFLIYKQVLSGGSTSAGFFSSGIEYRELLAEGKMTHQAIGKINPLSVQVFNLYNPYSGYATFIVPGILFIVIQQSLLIGIGLLTGKRNEKRKNGFYSSEQSISEHVVPTVLGKAFAYSFLYLFTTLFLFGCFYRWFSFPERGSFLSIYLVLIPYLLSISFAGISLTFLFRKRVNALMFIVFLSPAIFFLSGISWPVQSMPLLIHIISFIFPSTPMIPAFVKLRIIGGGTTSITFEWTVLMLQMMGYFLLACLATKIELRTVREKKERHKKE